MTGDQITHSPTREAYAELDKAYAFFNTALFDDRLPDCLITLQRSHDTLGYFLPNQFVNRSASNAHEIALNPSYFAIRSLPETLSVLVREMLSLDQHLNSAKPPRRRYRNKEWADMAEAVGLMPSDTGLPGGKRTGDGVLVYIIDGGAFDLACTQLLDDHFVLSWIDRFPPAKGASPQPAPAGNELDSEGEGELLLSDDPVDTGASSPDGSQDDDGLISGAMAAQDALSDDLGHIQPFEGVLVSLDGESAPAAPAASKPPKDVPPPPPMKCYESVAMESLADMGVEPQERHKNLSKTKFSCPVCKANAWGKPSLHLHCAGHGENMHDSHPMNQN